MWCDVVLCCSLFIVQHYVPRRVLADLTNVLPRNISKFPSKVSPKDQTTPFTVTKD